MSWCPCAVTACMTAASRTCSSLPAIARSQLLSLGISRQSMYLRDIAPPVIVGGPLSYLPIGKKSTTPARMPQMAVRAHDTRFGPEAPDARQRPANTRSRILDVGERLVQVRGFNGFSYADVAAELSVTKPSPH